MKAEYRLMTSLVYVLQGYPLLTHRAQFELFCQQLSRERGRLAQHCNLWILVWQQPPYIPAISHCTLSGALRRLSLFQSLGLIPPT